MFFTVIIVAMFGLNLIDKNIGERNVQYAKRWPQLRKKNKKGDL